MLKRKYSAEEINAMDDNQFLNLIKRIEKNPYYTTNSSAGFRGIPKSLFKKTEEAKPAKKESSQKSNN